ncbi:MAG: LysM peptidoglycan-binding domain-containing protein [Deltaproteobacteria bacterium]|nr:LysM peptidoglycan-binding domain-containing protein [Deltaproteobacteria bacterium]
MRISDMRSILFRLLPLPGILLCAGCVALEPYRTAEEGQPGRRVALFEPAPGPEKAEPSKAVPEASTAPASARKAESPAPPAPTGEQASTPSDSEGMPNQELLDSALDFCQASNEYWERGDLDNALAALDKAYSLILKVNDDPDADVLQQKEDLRFTISKRIIEVYASRFTVANGLHKAIPLEMNAHVKRALHSFKGREKNFFLQSYIRSGRYRPAIVRALKEAGLPKELSWLPLIESGFKVRAFSRARALGLWQFIASTGYKYGLKRDPWIDERMDPEKSTVAAIAYLKELHQIFGDWTTALASYNCGERAVLNRIRTQKINYLDNFWDLYEKLPRETAGYVPRFLAVLHIINDPGAHGFTLPPVDEEIRTEEVTINKQVHLKTIAEYLKVDYDLLNDMNAELRRDLTPEEPYVLKVPEGKSEQLVASLGDIPVWKPPVPAYVVHRVRGGDTLSTVARKYHSSVGAIMAANGLKRKDYLKVGWRLKVPSGREYVSLSKESPSSERKPSSQTFQYTVRKGDSLWKIANRFNATTKEIQNLNRLSNARLQIGQVLRLPSEEKGAAEKVQSRNYRVRRGDSPYLIAQKYQMSLADFLKLNNLTPKSTIFPGQTVLVRAD